MIVAISGFLATISESFIGAKFQDKYKLSNELVNSIQNSLLNLYFSWNLAPIMLSEIVARNPEIETIKN